MTQLQVFLGLVNYYSKFLPNLPSTLAPLYQLLTKNGCGLQNRISILESQSTAHLTMFIRSF